MARTRVTATYNVSDLESMQMIVDMPNDYPDALDQAKRTCLDGIREMVRTAQTEFADAEDEG